MLVKNLKEKELRKEELIEDVKKTEQNVQKEEVKTTKRKKSKKRMCIVLIFSIVALIIGYITLRGHYLEVKEIGERFLGSYFKNVNYKVITIVVAFAWIYFLVYSTNRRIKKGLKIFCDEEKKEMPRFPNKSISFITAAIGSVITSNIFLQKTILFLNNTSFGKTDPIYGHDIGYYLFIKPFLQGVLIYMLITIAIVTLYAAIYYIVLLNTHFSNGVSLETLKKSVLRKQLLNNFKVIIVIIAILTFINAEDLSSQVFINVGENNSSYGLVGAGLSDITIKVWAYRILSVLIFILGFVAASAYQKDKQRRLIGCIVSVPVYLLILMLVMMVYDKLFINTNEYEKEKKYIAYNIENTREAYGINTEAISLVNAKTIAREDILNNSDVIDNISTTNSELVLQSLNGSLTNKGYYVYTSAKPGIYNIGEDEKLVYITPREVVTNENAYTNSTYEFTHGYGVIVTSASQTDTSGDLINIQKEFSDEDNVLKIRNPRIYFGLKTNNTVVTNSKNKNEFDYPESETNNTNSYDGKAGMKLNTLDRITLALSKGDLNLAFTTEVGKDSKILTNRNVIERAKRVMPYLMYDENPYMVVTSDGRLVWVIDAYTTSKYYPYSQKMNVNGQEINYIKNSVKVLVDAYDGDIDFYITDRTDLIAMAYRNAFPEVFVDIDKKIPEEISEHFTYSEFLYNIQVNMLKRYHNTETDVIYRGNDIWEIPNYGNGIDSSVSETNQVDPYYSIVKTKDNKDSTLGLVSPYTNIGKQSITAYSVGSYEDGVMKLKLYKYPSDTSVLGPMQLDTQISQNESISKEIKTLNVSGTKLTKNIVVVPINDNLLYVESIYQEYINESDSLPKLKKIIVGSGNKIAIGDNLESAMNNLFSQGFSIEVENPENKDELIQSIIKANKALKESTENNDYEVIGKDIKQLQNLIDKLEKLEQEENAAETKETESILTSIL